MIQIAGIAAVCLLLTVLLRKENPTFALLVTVAGAGLLFYTVSKLAGSAFGISVSYTHLTLPTILRV